jgi:hypothetical protein
MPKKTKDKSDEQEKKPKIYGDPEYSAEDDIYSNEEKIELDGSGEDVKKTKRSAKDRLSGDLDVPGSELDDADEEIGEEDEENNYYSLGGDDHDDLEEDKGE